MKVELEKLEISKKKKLDELTQTRNNVLLLIYAGLSSNKSVKKIHKALYEATIKKAKTNTPMYVSSIKAVNKITKTDEYKKSIKNNLSKALMASLVFSLINRFEVPISLKQDNYKQVNKFENEEKKKIITDYSKKARDESKIFYLCSTHLDCAKDHLDFQGKLYFDQKWRNIIHDSETIKAVENYIKNHDVKPMQYIIGKPVWLITRPNCRHFFKSLATDDVLKSNVRSLLVNNKMVFKTGNKTYIQTISHSFKSEFYRKDNIENFIAQYKDRLDWHELLYKKTPCDELKIAISKDKFLIKKWKEYLQLHF